MEIRSLENALFEKWSETKVSFVKDGLINEDAWKNSKIKVQFILKEANSPKGGLTDLRDFVAKGGRSQTWDNVSRWSYGITHLDKEINWNEIKNISEDFRKEDLKSICVVNLKKAPGGHTTSNEKLREEAMLDKKHLIEQLRLYHDANIIICCGSGVSGLFHELQDDYHDYKWECTKRGMWYQKIGENKFLFNFLHPEVRIGTFDNILFYGLIDSIKEVLNR